MPPNQPIVIKDWQSGIADSPHLGHALLQNVEIDTFPGAARVGKQPATVFHATFTDTFTANSTTDVCTATTAVPNTGTAVKVSNSGGGLPGGLSANTIYFIINTGTLTFKLATTLANANAGTAIDITSNGTGTQTVSTIDPGTINHFARDAKQGNIFAIDSNGRVWVRQGTVFQLLLNSAIDNGGAAVTNASGQGIVIFYSASNPGPTKTYLFAFRNATIDVIDVSGTSNIETPSWSNNWNSLNSGSGSANSHHALLGQDNIIYFCDDRYIGSIGEKAGQTFLPGTLATYNFNNQALALPLNLTTYWLEQLGVNLLVSVSNDSFIYPWDRSSISYGLPIPVADYGINKMKNIGNIVYILAGQHGNIYWTQGTYVRPLKTIPIYATANTVTPTPTPVTWGGITSVLGKLLVGVAATNGKSGVYSFNVSTGILGVTSNAITIDNFPSTGQANVTALIATNELYFMGYAGGADLVGTSRYTSLGSVVIQSAFLRIGTKTTKAKISQIEVQIANGVTGNIRLSYRTDLSSAFTNITDPDTGLTTFTTDTSHTSYQADVGLIDLENIQIQIEMSGNIDLMEVRLNP